MERDGRVNAAAGIARTGLAGTPAAAGIANAVDAQMATNRFKNNLDTEVARQDLRLKGVDTAQNMANNVNRFYKEGAEARETAEGVAGNAFATYYETHKPQIDAAMANATSLAQLDPQYVAAAQQYYTAHGGQGEVPFEYVKNQWTSQSDLALHNPLIQAKNLLIEYGFTQEQAHYLASKIATGDLVLDSETGLYKVKEGGTIPGEADKTVGDTGGAPAREGRPRPTARAV